MPSPKLPARKAGGKRVAPTNGGSLPILSAQELELDDGTRIPVKIPEGDGTPALGRCTAQPSTAQEVCPCARMFQDSARMPPQQAQALLEYLKANPESAKEHKDSRNVNVERVVFNLGGGNVVNLRCGDEELCYWLAHGWGYFIGPVASGKAPVSDGLFSVVAGGRAAGRAHSEAWKEKAAREEANLPPTPRDKKLQAGRAAATFIRKRKIENASGLLGYQDTMRS
ncbi:hypothetical protein V8C86DRAFT_3123411 [Haematococcus lacustris]